MKLTLKTYLTQTASGAIDPKTFALETLQHIREKNADYFSFLRTHDRFIADHLDTVLDRPFHAAPIGIKDNIMLEGEITSCGSKMLEHYVAPYTATCVEKLIAA